MAFLNYFSVFLAATAVHVSATPVAKYAPQPTPQPKYKVVSYVDTYDSAAQQVKGLTPFIPSSFVNGTAGGALGYNAFGYVNGALSQLTLASPSPPDSIAFGVLTEAAQGQPAWYTLNSNVLFFDQKSLAYACVAQDATAVGIPITCTIQATGVKYGTGETVVKELVYNPALLPVGQTFGSMLFPDTFVGLVRVDIELVQSLVPAATTVLLFDNNAYNAYIKT